MEPADIHSLGEKRQEGQVLAGAVREFGEGVVQGDGEGAGATFFLSALEAVESLAQGID